MVQIIFSEPIMEEELNGRSLRSGSITHGNEMSFLDFADLFRTFRFENWFTNKVEFVRSKSFQH